MELLSGRVALAEGDGPRAADWTARALASLVAANPSNSSVLPTRTFLARCLNASGRFDEALTHAEECAAQARERIGDLPHSSAVGAALVEVAVAHRGLGDAEAARAAATEALVHLVPTLGTRSRTTLRAERLRASLDATAR